MSFDYPSFLYLFFLFLLFLPMTFIWYRKKRESAALFAAASLSKERKALQKELRQRLMVSEIFFLLFIAFIIFALSGPRWGMRIVPDHRRGVDLILAFDLSQSMNVRDEADNASRIERALEIASELANHLDDIRLGAVIGRGRGVLAVPLTYDNETVQNFLHGLGSHSISGSGTNLENLIDAASNAFQDSVPSRRGIILFSDGEALSGSYNAAIDRARRNVIFVSAVGLGSEAGGFIPVEVSTNEPEGFLLDAGGREILSQRHAALLRSGAERSGGFYIDGSRQDAVQLITEFIDNISAESRVLGFRREENPRWQIFIIAAIMSFMGMRLMAYGFYRREGKRKRKNKTVKALGIIFILLLFNSCNNVQGMLSIMEGNFHSVRGYYPQAISSYMKALDYPDSVPYAEYGLGSVFYALGESEAALERFTAAKDNIQSLIIDEHRELHFRIFYNMGIIYFINEDYDEAVNAFRESLKIDSSRIEAKQNLELSLLSIARRSSLPAPLIQEEDDEYSEGPDAISIIIFDYLREMEQEQWRSREWEEDESYSGPDY